VFKSRKLIATLMVVAMLLSMIPMTAFAAGITKSGTVAVVKADTNADLGTVLVEIPAGALRGNDELIVSLPSGFKFLDGSDGSGKDVDWSSSGVASTYEWYGAKNGDSSTESAGAVIRVPAKLPGTTIDNDLYDSSDDPNAAKLTVSRISDNQIKITTAENVNNVANAAVFYINLRQVYVDDGFTGDIELYLTAPSGSGFPSGKVVVGRVGDGTVNVTTADTQTASNTFTFTAVITESLQGSMKLEDEAVVLTLPDGYEWSHVGSQVDATPLTKGGTTNILTATAIYGDDLNYTVTVNAKGDELRINTKGFTSDNKGLTSRASRWDIPLTFRVNDSSKCVAGDIMADVTGGSAAKASVKVGKYGEFGATVTVPSELPTIYSGREKQKIADITIQENLAGSILEGRTVTLELPEGARWQKQQEATTAQSSTTNQNLKLTNGTFGGTDNRRLTLTAQVGAAGGADIATASAAKVKLEKFQVQLEPGFTGDLKIKIGGTAGINEEITVAKVITPGTIEVSEKSDLIIGKKGQELGDIIIKENQAGAFNDESGYDVVTVNLKHGTWTSAPKVEVVEGDIQLGTVTVSGANLNIVVSRKSRTASTIKIVDPKVDLDRTIPEGDFPVRLRGTALIDYARSKSSDVADPFPNTTNVASASAGTVITPAPGEALAKETVFTIGSTTYTVDGVEKTMDVAPYIKDNRTFVPVRFAAQAMGVAEKDIIWDGAKGTATLFKGDRIIQMTIGSNIMTVNGVQITMDTAPEIVNNRTMLPVGWLAQALNVTATWDGATQTATLSSN